jgi:hypothetical protein
MPLRALTRLGLALVVLATAACGPPIDLTKALEVTDVLTGFYDDGVHTKSLGDGAPPRPANVLRPSITFKLKNISAQPLTSVQLMASYWQAGGDGEWDSIMATGISTHALPSGESTPAITLRSNTAFNVEGARASLFGDHRYKDIVIKLFGKRGGQLYRLGEYNVDRVILPHAGREASRQ